MDPVADGLAAHDVGREGSDPRMRGGNMPLAVSRHEQESHSPVVQYAGLRKPHEGAKIPSTSRTIATLNYSADGIRLERPFRELVAPLVTSRLNWICRSFEELPVIGYRWLPDSRHLFPS